MREIVTVHIMTQSKPQAMTFSIQFALDQDHDNKSLTVRLQYSDYVTDGVLSGMRKKVGV